MSALSLSRREFLGALLTATTAAGLVGCSTPRQKASITVGSAPAPGGLVTKGVRLRARVIQADLAGRTVTAWGYGDSIPGKAIRASVGERLRITVSNELPEQTSVHWHGLTVPNPMDGVPGVTTPSIQPGESFGYEFVVPDAGTHWFHPHTGLQLDTGLYAPFIVDDPADPGAYDDEWILVLDDWTQGVGPSPQQVYDSLVAQADTDAQSRRMDGGPMPMSGMGHGGMGMDGGDVTYPMFLINGRPAADPDVLRAKRGDRIRLRIINAGADTVFTVAVGGHQMRVTHSDGFPVRPVDAQSVRIGMGERYDAIVEVADGVFPVVAEPVGKTGYGMAVIRSASGGLPRDVRPSGLSAYPTTVGVLQAASGAALPGGDPQTTHDVVLSGSMSPYRWTINGATYADARPLTVKAGEMARLRLSNMSMMSHPIHLHGHTFQLGAAAGTGPRKDTLLLPPMASAEVDLLADNPGRWMLHCHNAYHAEAGMMTRLDYTT